MKQDLSKHPNLLGLSADVWFRRGIRSIGARIIPIGNSIAQEAALVPAIYGWGDPGDCFLIATAHLRDLTLITRDARILEFSNRNPAYLKVLEC